MPELKTDRYFLFTWDGLEHQDWRYAELRSQSGFFWLPVNFFGIHLIPTILVFLGCIPLYYALSIGSRELNIYDALALFTGIASVWLEYQSDAQLHRFRRQRQTRQEVLMTGLWSWCRHPNYLGDWILVLDATVRLASTDL